MRDPVCGSATVPRPQPRHNPQGEKARRGLSQKASETNARICSRPGRPPLGDPGAVRGARSLFPFPYLFTNEKGAIKMSAKAKQTNGRQDVRAGAAAKFAELVEWGREAGRNIFRRVQRAAELLADREWVADRHEGQWQKAYDAIERECFAELAGFVKLQDMLRVLEMFPERAQWGEHRFDLLAMLALYDEQKARRRAAAAGGPPPAAVAAHRKRATGAQIRDLEQTLAEREDRIMEQAVTIENQEGLVSRQKARIDELETEVRRLSIENRRLKSRPETLEGQQAMAVA